jgi:hypothetical protein
MVMSLKGLGLENDSAGEGQQQLYTTDSASRKRGCYIRPMTAKCLVERNTSRGSHWAWCQDELIGGKPNKKKSMVLVRKRSIPTEQPPPVGEVNANFCG